MACGAPAAAQLARAVTHLRATPLRAATVGWTGLILLECSVGAFYGVDRYGSSAAGGAAAAFAGLFAPGGTRTVLLQGYSGATAVSKDRY